MKFNYGYVLDFPARVLPEKQELTVLDFGCGEGEVVSEGIARGINIYGADVHIQNQVQCPTTNPHSSGAIIREIKQGNIPFADDYFDYVISNQVFEHVEDLDIALKEISRVLKPNGTMLCTFPTKDVWREVHCGIPFIHWFSKNSRFRYPYLVLLRKFGFGKYKNDQNATRWAKETLIWMDKACFYRDRKTIFQMMNRYFVVTNFEDDYIQQRLFSQGISLFAGIRKIPLLNLATKEVFRKFGGLILTAKNKKRALLINPE
jgi:ubiquinone/menaquinone biosynthesis C-methylase UbiE